MPPPLAAGIADCWAPQAVGSVPPAESHQAQNLLGLMLGRKGAAGDDVLAAFRAAIRIRPDYAEAHNNLGLVLIQSGKDEEGMAALREAVRLAPAYADARTNLGAALTPTDTEAAIKELEEAVRLAPGSVKALFNLAVAYGTSSAHGPSKEIEYLEKVIDSPPTFAGTTRVAGTSAGQEAARSRAKNGRDATRKRERYYQLGLRSSGGVARRTGGALKKGPKASRGDRANALPTRDGRAALEGRIRRGESQKF